MKTDNHRSDRGGVLVVVLVTVVILGCLGVGFMRIGADVGMEASQDIHRANAFWTAEAGIEHVRTMVRNKRDKLEDAIVLPNVITGATSRGSYAVSISNAWDNVVHVYKKYVITSTGIVRGSGTQTNVISLRAYLPTFARYAHSSHNENGVVFTTGDVVDGPVQVDNTLNISGTPLFLDLVRAPRVNPTSAANNTSIFRGGIDVNPAYTNNFVDGSSYFARIKSDAQATGLSLSGNHTFRFLTNKFTYFSNTATNTVYTNTTLLSREGGGTIYVNGNITLLGGVMDGRLSVAAQQYIYLSNDIVYASARNPNPWQTNTFDFAAVDDFLGLVASNGVTITKRDDINIHASILVTRGGFGATAYNLNIGQPDIFLFGSLGQYTRGTVGQVGVNGFRKKYKFDRRFEYDGPPSSAYDFYQFSGWTRVSSE